MKKDRGVNEYTIMNLSGSVHFPKGHEVCRYCPFCVADPSNHKREVCFLTRTTLVYADISMEGDCPLI